MKRRSLLKALAGAAVLLLTGPPKRKALPRVHETLELTPEEIHLDIPADGPGDKAMAWYYVGGFKAVWDCAPDADSRVVRVYTEPEELPPGDGWDRCDLGGSVDALRQGTDHRSFPRSSDC